MKKYDATVFDWRDFAEFHEMKFKGIYAKNAGEATAKIRKLLDFYYPQEKHLAILVHEEENKND